MLAHNPKRSDTKPYLSRDEKLQSIIDSHKNCIFISGHTHVSMENIFGCVEYDRSRKNYYINDGSIRPTTLLDADGRAGGDPADGNVVEIDFYDDYPEITAVSVETGERLPGPIMGDCNWEGPVTREEVIGILTDHYPDIIQSLLQKNGILGHSGGFDFALNVGCASWDSLHRFGVFGEFKLLHLERRFFQADRFLVMMKMAQDRYIQSHPDEAQQAISLYEVLCEKINERKTLFEKEK